MKTKNKILFLTGAIILLFAARLNAQTAPINILNATPLAATAGDTKEAARFGNNTANASRLLVYFWRHTAGTNWLSAATRIQNFTDATSQAYMEFNPKGLPGGLTFGTQSTPNALSVSDGGFVGIGTTAPVAPFHVNRGTVLSSVAGQTSEIARISGNINNQGTIIFYNFRHTAGANWLSASTRIQNFTDATGQGFIEFNPAGGPHGLSLGTSVGGYGINISSTAAVGMGTWDTRGYKLAVVGGILCDKVKVAVPGSAQWADYVFDKDYRLKPLSQVEAYIKTNRHLEGMPTTEEVNKEGIDIAPVTAKLLEKIEELTLYLIELKKENNTRQRQIEELKKEIHTLKNKTGK